MRLFIVVLTVVMAACLAAASPIDLQRRLVNRPSPALETRVRRSDHHVKGRPYHTNIRTSTEPALRKGEYICGNKVCKLKWNDPPPCPYCQMPVGPIHLEHRQ